MKVNNNNKNGSNAKKIIPAVGMLSVSAVMLASSTFAWFTMSREVEVTGIKMTASVPEGIEVSLGDGMISTAGRHTLTVDSNATNATKIKAPTNAGGSSDLDWTNSVAVSDYYKFGYLIPASSTTGTDIFYTLDANDAGRSVAVDAEFKQADVAGDNNAMTTYGVGSNYGTYNIETSKKGYYIDIPVWFRTSTASDAALAVEVKIYSGINDGTNTTGTGDLYKAARVAILNANGAENTNTANKLLYGSNIYAASTVTDAQTPANNRTAIADGYYNRYTGTTYSSAAITAPQAVKAAATLTGALASGVTPATALENADDAYGTAQFVTQPTQNATTKVWSGGDTVVTVPAPVTPQSGTRPNYGASIEKTIRVWLEGEDVNCWNPNAAQSFTVDLKFVRQGAINDPTAPNQTAQQSGSGS